MSENSRRRFLKTLSLSALGAAFSPALLAGTPSSSNALSRPNILLILADDWSWPHASRYGDSVVKTPNFDRIGREGVVFNNAYCSVSSCTPSRATILSGQIFWRLGKASILGGDLPVDTPVYTDILEAAGYKTAYGGKGLAPGGDGGWDHNPAGRTKTRLSDLLDDLPAGKQFCFWLGAREPHRPYERGSGVQSGMELEKVKVPGFLPDNETVRSDLCDYYYKVQRFDSLVGRTLGTLERRGYRDNTLIIVTSDNGMPFPRAKANCYEYSTHMPLAITWPGRIQGGRVVKDPVSFDDLAPTLLDAAGMAAPAAMTGRSFLQALTLRGWGGVGPARNRVFFGLDSHRWSSQPYPMRALKKDGYLFITNLEPGIQPFSSCPSDAWETPTGKYMKAHIDDPLYELAWNQRPSEELYLLERDPFQLTNLAPDPAHAVIRQRLRDELDQYRCETGDPYAASCTAAGVVR